MLPVDFRVRYFRYAAVITQRVKHIAAHMIENVNTTEVHCFKGPNACIPQAQSVLHDIVYVFQAGITHFYTVAGFSQASILQTVENKSGGILIYPDGLLMQAVCHITHNLQDLLRAMLSGNDLHQGN